MKHTISMYENKDSMIEAMQKDIDSLEAQLAEEKYVSERALNAFAKICVASEIFPDTNEKMQIDQTIEKVLAKLTEARKDRERLDYVLDHLKENTDLHNMTGHPEDNGVFLTYWGTGFAYTTRDDIDAAMKGGE